MSSVKRRCHGNYFYKLNMIFLKTLMQFLDRDNSGTIDMNEFLVGIRVKIEY